MIPPTGKKRYHLLLDQCDRTANFQAKSNFGVLEIHLLLRELTKILFFHALWHKIKVHCHNGDILSFRGIMTRMVCAKEAI